MLLAVAELDDADLAPAEKAGIRGIANTLMGLQLLLTLNTRDTNGIPTAVNPDPTGTPEPFKTDGGRAARSRASLCKREARSL